MKIQAPGAAGIVILLSVAFCRQLVNFAAPPTPAPTASSQAPALVSFISKPGRYAVMLPFAWDVEEFTATKNLFEQTLECPTIFYRLNGAGATVQYCDLPPEIASQVPGDQILDQARVEMMREFRARIDDQKSEITQDAYPSLVLTGQADMRGLGYDGTIKARLILANNRIYLVEMRVYQDNWCQCLDQIDVVVDSLYIE